MVQRCSYDVKHTKLIPKHEQVTVGVIKTCLVTILSKFGLPKFNPCIYEEADIIINEGRSRGNWHNRNRDRQSVGETRQRHAGGRFDVIPGIRRALVKDPECFDLSQLAAHSRCF